MLEKERTRNVTKQQPSNHKRVYIYILRYSKNISLNIKLFKFRIDLNRKMKNLNDIIRHPHIIIIMKKVLNNENLPGLLENSL